MLQGGTFYFRMTAANTTTKLENAQFSSDQELYAHIGLKM